VAFKLFGCVPGFVGLRGRVVPVDGPMRQYDSAADASADAGPATAGRDTVQVGRGRGQQLAARGVAGSVWRQRRQRSCRRAWRGPGVWLAGTHTREECGAAALAPQVLFEPPVLSLGESIILRIVSLTA
jgi:hypothetical protein